MLIHYCLLQESPDKHPRWLELIRVLDLYLDWLNESLKQLSSNIAKEIILGSSEEQATQSLETYNYYISNILRILAQLKRIGATPKLIRKYSRQDAMLDNFVP